MYEINCDGCNRKGTEQIGCFIEVKLKEDFAFFKLGIFKKLSVAQHILDAIHRNSEIDIKVKLVKNNAELNVYL